MGSVYRATYAMLCAAIALTVLGFLCILAITKTAINADDSSATDIKMYSLIGIFTILVLVTPFFWFSYSCRRILARVVSAVCLSESVTIAELSGRLGRDPSEVRYDVSRCLRKGWLSDYSFIEQDDLVKKTSPFDVHHAVCEHCNVHFQFRGTDARCPYCGKKCKGKILD